MIRQTIQEWLKKYRPKVLQARPKDKPKTKNLKYQKYKDQLNHYKPPKSLKS